MTDEPIPAELRDFILRHIDSVAQLEALLLLFWEKSTDWSAAKLSKRLYISEGEALAVLGRLTADGFAAEADGRYRFNPEIAEREHMLEQLANAYSTRLIPITNLIHSKPARIREFSDAFKLRKDRT
jgi:predicted ArsR family transcriptional regulator